MSSPPITTQITRIECSDEENKPNEDILSDKLSFETQFSSDSDSDDFLEDNRYERNTDETDICEEALQTLKQLYLKNNFKKLEIIQRESNKNEGNHQMVSHVVLTDQNVDPIEDLTDGNKNIFESKAKLLKISETKIKERADKKQRNKKSEENPLFKEIPENFNNFLEEICNLKTDLIFDPNSKVLFGFETHHRDIRFNSHESYVNSFIPFVIRQLWSDLKANAKQDLISYQMTYDKNESEERIKTIILSHIRQKSSIESVFKFGQMVVIKYAITQEQDSEESKVESHFGIIIGVSTELIDKESEYLSHPLILSQTNEEENEFLLETLIIHCNPLEPSFESVSVVPISVVQKHLLEARIVYELKDQKFGQIFKQILKPNFTFLSFGFSVDLKDRTNLYSLQKDGIQKAYEVCLISPNYDTSSFVAIYGGPKTGKTEILIETAHQLLRTGVETEERVKKLIIIAMGTNHLTNIIETLKKQDIKVFHISSDGKCLSHSNSELRRTIKKMNKNNKFNDIVGKDYSFEQCLKFYGQQMHSTDLTVRDIFVKESIDKNVTKELMIQSEVIIGSIASVMNNESFNGIFNSNNANNIKCCLIDESHLLTETEVWTLLFSGVRSFALFGDITKNPMSYEKCESFFQRYVRMYNKNGRTNSNQSSVLYLNETIEALQRFAEKEKNKRNYDYRRSGRNNSRPPRGRQMAASSYGSEYFNTRFKNSNNSIKNESKNGIDFNGADNRYPNHINRSDEKEVFPTPSQSTSQVPHNPMINGLVPDRAYGGRHSYLSHLNEDYNNQYYSPLTPRSDSFGANSDSNANYPSNGSQFVSNPTRHQNHNFF